MSNLDYIEQLGVGEDQETSGDTEAAVNNTTEESNEDFVQDSEASTSETEDTKLDTEQDSELDALKKQIAGMEKRIADKDEYINELREASKQKEAEQQQGDTNEEDEEEEDFWANPEQKVKQLEKTLKAQQDMLRMQDLRLQEAVYANTVKDYWKTVNPDALKEAVATDAEFADKFNSSKEPYKTAYEYLTDRQSKKAESEKSLRDRIRQELMEEMGVKQERREAPPSINGGKSTSTKDGAPDDGFASVFGVGY